MFEWVIKGCSEVISLAKKKAQPEEVAPQKGNTKLHAQNNGSIRPFNPGVLWKKARGCPWSGQASR
jgi:hypothetical protein